MLIVSAAVSTLPPPAVKLAAVAAWSVVSLRSVPLPIGLTSSSPGEAAAGRDIDCVPHGIDDARRARIELDNRWECAGQRVRGRVVEPHVADVEAVGELVLGAGPGRHEVDQPGAGAGNRIGLVVVQL